MNFHYSSHQSIFDLSVTNEANASNNLKGPNDVGMVLLMAVVLWRVTIGTKIFRARISGTL